MTVTFIEADPNTPYPLGRSVVNHDPRNRAFAALQQPGLTAQPKPGTAWFTRDVYDQQGSSCTANAAVGVMRTGPFRAIWPAIKDQPNPWDSYDTDAERFYLYRAAQSEDPWPGQEPDYEGSSTDAPFKVMRNRGQVPGWRFLFGEAELEEWVTLYGPAAIGVNFYDDMFEPNAQGEMVPTGGLAGGHAMRIVQFHLKRKAYRVVNSWGRRWGAQGRAWITQPHMRQLLAEEGEAVTVQMAA